MKKLNKQLKAEIIVISVILILIVTAVYLAFQWRNEIIRANVAEEKLQMRDDQSGKRYKRDSLNLANQYKYNVSLKDSTRIYTKGQQSKEIPIIKYYDAKIHYTQAAPSSVIDKQFDSILSILSGRYK